MSLMTSPTGHLSNLSTSTLPPEVRRVALTVDVEVPWGVGDMSDVTVAALGRESAEAPVDGSSSVLVASDDGGTVLLALADEDGGYLDGGSGAVEVGIESTALVLAAASSGHRLHQIDRSFADVIRDHADFGHLVDLLTGLMASDVHYLDRLYDYPDAVALVRAVASGAVEAFADSGAGVAASPVPSVLKRAVGASSGEVDGLQRNDFYCYANNRVMEVVAGVVEWFVDMGRKLKSLFFGLEEKEKVHVVVACSPWSAWKPWTWYGGPEFAKGIESLNINWWSVPFDLASSYHDVAINAARDGVPFLAVTAQIPQDKGNPPARHRQPELR